MTLLTLEIIRRRYVQLIKHQTIGAFDALRQAAVEAGLTPTEVDTLMQGGENANRMVEESR